MFILPHKLFLGGIATKLELYPMVTNWDDVKAKIELASMIVGVKAFYHAYCR